jgi:hypothetical protein
MQNLKIPAKEVVLQKELHGSINLQIKMQSYAVWKFFSTVHSSAENNN